MEAGHIESPRLADISNMPRVLNGKALQYRERHELPIVAEYSSPRVSSQGFSTFGEHQEFLTWETECSQWREICSYPDLKQEQETYQRLKSGGVHHQNSLTLAQASANNLTAFLPRGFRADGVSHER